jgi:peptide subunit release factor RF-3
MSNCLGGGDAIQYEMSFVHEGLAFNLLDTPGRQDFSPSGF